MAQWWGGRFVTDFHTTYLVLILEEILPPFFETVLMQVLNILPKCADVSSN
jgi:hypothetical protein